MLQDGVFDGCKHEPDVFCVSSTRKVRINDFVLVWIQFDKHLQDKFPGGLSVSLGSLERIKEMSLGKVF